ncbi:MAG: AMP-binding protein [Candidatus Hinthialibacter antarcticus]|nr:AMP-binding protein [Candidatus Hinthialibacter antarcticus]
MNDGCLSTRADIQAAQLKKLNALLEAIIPTNKFYTKKYQDAGFKFPLNSLDEFYANAPFTTKHELVEDQKNHPPYGTNLSEPIENYVRYSQTSGTSGYPMRWLDTQESWDWVAGNWMNIFREVGVTPADRVFFAFSFGPFLGFWAAFNAAERIGCLCIPGGAMSSVGRLQTMFSNNATVLCCTPTYALRLAQSARDERMDISRCGVKKIIVAGEPGGSTPSVRQRIESEWNARLFDHHGMTEVGPVTFESLEHRGVLHPLEPNYLVEVLHPDTLEPVESGETGELILTPLGRSASPLLRYRTGDMVRVSWDNQKKYGRPEAAFPGGILGRYDDMVIVRGVNLYPSAIDEIIRRCGDAVEYRVEICAKASMTEMKILVEPAAGYDHPETLPHRLSTELYKTYHLRIPIETVSPGTLPRFEMKAKRWIRTHE